MTNKLKTALFAAASILAVSAPASAEVIIIGDPSGVFPADIETNSEAPLILIGAFDTPGEVEVNADATGNGFTNIHATGSGFQVGSSTTSGGGAGVLRVIGDGSAGSASALSDTSFAAGIGGDGLVEISNGGLVSAKVIQVGSTSAHDADIIVDGAGSTLEATGGDIGFSGEGVGTSRSITVRNGGTASAYGGEFGSNIQVNIGDTFTVTGDGSSADFEVALSVDGAVNVLDGGRIDQFEVPGLIDGFPADFATLQIGSLNYLNNADIPMVHVSGANSEISLTRRVKIGGSDSVIIDENGMLVEDPAGGFVTAGTSGVLLVENNGIFRTTSEILVSGEGDGASGVLTVRSGANVFADSITVSTGGLLDGNNGFIIADVNIAGGVLAPGDSPGAMLIDGDLTFQSAASVLQIEIAGTGPGDFDVITVLGDLFAPEGFTLELSFLDGFAPEVGETFEFLNISGENTLDFAMLQVMTSGLPDSFAFDLGFANGVFSLQTISASSEVPVPGAFLLMFSGLAGLGAAKKLRVGRMARQ